MEVVVLIAVVGVGFLVWLGVMIGTELDTTAQRRARRRLAEERRLLGEQRAAPAGFVLRRCDADGLCLDCPFR